MPKLLVVDTSILTLMLSPTMPRQTDDQLHWPYARRLLLEPSCRRPEGLELAVAAPVVVEVLASQPVGKHETLIEWFNATFTVLSMDTEATHIAGRIAAPISARRSPKQCYKFDTLICACAARWEALAICAKDGDFQTLSSRLDTPLPVGPPAHFIDGQESLLGKTLQTFDQE